MVLRTTAALRKAARTQIARYRCRLCWLVGRRWCRRRRCKREVEAKIRVGSQSERPRAPNQALARGSWRPRSASEASCNGQERKIRHWQGEVGGQEARRKPVGTAKNAKSGTGKGELAAKKCVESQSEGPRAPNQALARGSLTPRCALEASRNAKSGTDKGEFERKARKGSPRESRGGARSRGLALR